MSSKDEEPKLTVPKFSSFKPASKPSSESKEPKVPRFSSFKSKEPSTSQKDPEEKRDSNRESRKRSRHSDSHGRPHHRSKHSRRDSHERNRERIEPKPRLETPSQPQSAPKDLKQGTGIPGLYIVDLKGDPLITRYGGIDRSQIPSYHRYGAGRVLGTKGRLVIHRDGPRDQFSLRMPGQGSAAFAEKKGLHSKSWKIRPKPIRIRKQEETANEDDNEEFIQVRSSKKRKRDSEDVFGSSGEEEGPSYRSIEGKAKPHQYSDSELDYDSNESDDLLDVDQSNPLKWKSMQLSRRVKDDPADIAAWLELAEHQDALLRAGEDIDRKALEGELHSFAEIKVSMLESALSNTSSTKDRERVLVPLMKEGTKVWNSKTAAKKWAELLDDEEHSFEIWKTHLDFAMSDISTFQYEDIKKMCIDRLQKLTSRFAPESSKEVLGESIYVFLRMTRFIHDSGYKELAVAAWQAALELTFFRPAHLDGSGATLAAFQDFWESEVPRVGDADAQGWSKFVEAGGFGDAPDPVQDAGDPKTESQDDYKNWARIEQSRAEKANVPARTMDEGTEDDPFQVVMYSDIEELLLVFPAASLADVAPQLIDAFLMFLRLPPAFRYSSWMEGAYHDQFLTGLSGGVASIHLEKPAEDPSEETQKKLPFFERGHLHAACSPDILFSDSSWFEYIPSQAQGRAVELTLALNTTKHLVHSAKFEGLAQYSLALCSRIDGNSVKKAAKALLKRYPTNFGLYNAYALAELSNDRAEVAAKVLASATQLASDAPELDNLWRSWAWIELSSGNKQLAVMRLCSSTDSSLRTAEMNTEVSSSQILKAQQFFESNTKQSVITGHFDAAGIFAECHALLSYLTADAPTEPMSGTQGNISAAMAAIESASFEIEIRGFAEALVHEQILQFAAKLLYHNACRGPFRRAYMLDQLKRFIHIFPQNTIFLSLFEWADSSLRVIDEVRTLLHEKVLNPQQDTFSSRLFAIQHEIQRGNANTTQAAFEHALTSDACKSSTALWILYMRFCSVHRVKGKEILFRALRHCPWSKEVMMEAFVSLNRELESSELKGVFNTMTTKGLRVHVDLEEFLDRRRGERKALKGVR